MITKKLQSNADTSRRGGIPTQYIIIVVPVKKFFLSNDHVENKNEETVNM